MSALLRSDGQILVLGAGAQQGQVPALPTGRRYVDVALSDGEAAAIRSDGTAVSWPAGLTPGSYFEVSVPPRGVSYVAVEGGAEQILLRRSDGQVVGLGYPWYLETRVPPLVPGTSYTAIAA